MWAYHNGFGWWMLFGGIWMLLFWGIVIGLVVWGVSKITGSAQRPRDTNETPLDIAKRRFASGEITREQFDELREVLQG